MIISSVDLTNFRNHAAYHQDFNPDTTLILGENGCGKTSIIEAVYILTQGKSFRATDPEILKRDADFYRISLDFTSGQSVSATYDGNEKIFKTADGKKVKRLTSKQKYPVVLFEPDDLNLITASPSKHRAYFDRFFSQFSADYASAVNKYTKAIQQRNKLLKMENCTRQLLEPWNILISNIAPSIVHFRNQFTQVINQSLDSTYHSIAENNDHISLFYKTDEPNITVQRYRACLEGYLERDRILGRTSYGIQHDDFEFIFNNQNASGSASRGESRSIILALKFVEANLLEQKLRVKPLILLDDVFSELDQTRRECLIQNFKDHQVVITSVEALESLT